MTHGEQVDGLAAGLRAVLDRRARVKLAIAAIGAAVLALLDTLAVSLILPLVDLATGQVTSPLTASLRAWLGNPDPQTLLIWLTIAVVLLFIVKNLGRDCPINGVTGPTRQRGWRGRSVMTETLPSVSSMPK
ncbi:hypothetical protein, partial [Nostocoides australiense]